MDDNSLAQALVEARDESRIQVDALVRVEQAILALGISALRHLGSSDRAIAKIFAVSRNRIPELARLDGLPAEPWARDLVRARWREAQLAASPWTENPEIGRCGELLELNGIAARGEHHDRMLDTSAAEFVHQHTGEKILLYVSHRVERIADGEAGRSCTLYGRYVVEHVEPSGPRTLCELGDFALPPDAGHFESCRERPTDRGSAQAAFTTVGRAIRRKYRILPADIGVVELVATEVCQQLAAAE
ncbi:hypothetical protein ABH922_000243 [Rhodococcus sp. 27YEA15]|uniref:hypothetical protein n=1 Tax=Rhodococcus sp. 27YEA15 TaxID=3156259 RepID=UPI003C7BCA90